jgi:hypothetical protein
MIRGRIVFSLCFVEKRTLICAGMWNSVGSDRKKQESLIKSCYQRIRPIIGLQWIVTDDSSPSVIALGIVHVQLAIYCVFYVITVSYSLYDAWWALHKFSGSGVIRPVNLHGLPSICAGRLHIEHIKFRTNQNTRLSS